MLPSLNSGDGCFVFGEHKVVFLAVDVFIYSAD